VPPGFMNPLLRRDQPAGTGSRPAGDVPISRPIPAAHYVEHFDPDLSHHRAWLLAVLEQLVAHEPQALGGGRHPESPLDHPPGGRNSRCIPITVELTESRRCQQGQPAVGAVVCPAGFRHRPDTADVLLVQLRHAAGLPEARRPHRLQRRRPVPGPGSPPRRRRRRATNKRCSAHWSCCRGWRLEQRE